MKITFLSQWQGINTRGVETYVTELSQRLKSFGHQVTVHKNIWDHVDASTQILISTNGRLDAIFAKIWCLINHAKLIIPGQSGFGWDDKLNLWVFPDIFIGLTNFQCAWAKRINPWVKSITIPNGVDLDKFNSQVKPYITKKPRPIILNVGVVDSFKRQDLLLQAAKKIAASVLLVGKGGDMALSHNRMPNIYTACDLFSYPTSSRESFGIAMLEAMASGLAVVATDDPIRREIVGDAGLFVDPTDISVYADTLKKALSIKWGNKPRLQAEKFSWDKIARQYETLFNSL